MTTLNSGERFRAILALLLFEIWFLSIIQGFILILLKEYFLKVYIVQSTEDSATEKMTFSIKLNARKLNIEFGKAYCYK